MAAADIKKIEAIVRAFLALGLSVTIGAYGEDESKGYARDAQCQWQPLCNGDLCSSICKTGSVVADDWTSRALAYQRKLQRSHLVPIVETQFPGTHNSHISESYGYGIEAPGFAALLDRPSVDLYPMSGVSQFLSITDQLNIGIRHIEIDIYYLPIVDEVIVCHSPVPLDILLLEDIAAAVKRKNITLHWDVSKLSCVGTSVTLENALNEIRTWQDRFGPDDIVIVYFDTKFMPDEQAAGVATRIINETLGPRVLAPAEGDPLNMTVSELVERGKTIIIENVNDVFRNPQGVESLVFTPPLWNGFQFGGGSLSEFPNCTINGQFTVGRNFTRALDGSITQPATRCGVNIVSGDMANPDTMKGFVWALAEGVSPDFEEPCFGMLSSGRWDFFDCSMRLRGACLCSNGTRPLSQRSGALPDEDLEWTLSDAADTYVKVICPPGCERLCPLTPYSNAVLNYKALANPIWLSPDCNV